MTFRKYLGRCLHAIIFQVFLLASSSTCAMMSQSRILTVPFQDNIQLQIDSIFGIVTHVWFCLKRKDFANGLPKMDTADATKLFSPSEWNKRCSATDVLTNFIKLAEEATLWARENTCCELDIPYGPSDRMKYDVYGTNLPKDAPIFVFIHGGYWYKMSKDVGATFPVKSCVAEGIKVICLGYDLCPNVQVRDIICETKTAMNKILDDAAKSGSRGVWIGGHSAGAHLSASILDPEWLQNDTNGTLLKGFVLISGIYFLEPLIATEYNDVLKLDTNEARLVSTLNVELKVPMKNLKALVVVGENDSPKFIEQSRLIMKKLCSSMDEVEYVLYRNGIDHFNIMENLVDEDFPLTQRIIKMINGVK